MSPITALHSQEAKSDQVTGGQPFADIQQSGFQKRWGPA